MPTMRKVSSQLALIGLTIACALAVGYAIAALTSGSQQITPVADFVLAPQESAVAGLPEVTVTAEANATPAASATPRASAAPSAQPSTGAPASAPAEVFIEESFDKPSTSFPPRQEATYSAAYVDGQYQLRLNGQTNIALVGALPLLNYRLTVDVSAVEGGAGVVFLGTPPPGISYRLLIMPDRTYSIERQQDTTVEKVVDWTPSEALAAEPGARNRLRLERRGDTVRFFANEQPLATFEVPDGNFTNRYGFVLMSRNGVGEASFDNLRGEKLP